MKSHSKLLFGLTALALGGTLAGGALTQGFALSAFATDAPNAKKGASEAAQARKAIAKRKAAKAVQHAEAAVSNDPQNADYRALLGQAYLLSGRFGSAAQALNDALTLNPEDGRVALNLALAKIAGGDWAGARATLQTHADQIPASDRGLALALAGDPVSAVEVLMPAARAVDATAKTRQNLALSLALAGRWAEARKLAEVDVAADQLDARIMEWAKFSRPTNAYDQVASLLGVTAVQDAGQPVRLALVQQPNVQLAAVAPAPQPVVDPVDAFMPGAPVASAEAPAETNVQVASVEPQPEVQQIAGTGASVVFGPREEIVQPLPVRAAVKPTPAIVRRERVAAPTVQSRRGNYYVQLGAYANSSVARDAWARHTRRVPRLASNAPQGAKISTRAGNFYRLSVGGFARSDADSLCRQLRSTGGACFVRVQAGDALASWAKPGRNAQLASR
ncbi:SPOR domain-containing protein [Sphingomonas sp.]|uniref:SPOR domain-containing protein n=1 Tax=Sphingomonas sp. TaxID=28214 RepID=UPI002ED96C9D